MSCSSQTDELAHLEKSMSVSYSFSFSGVVIAAGPLSGTPASRSLAHGLSYANVPVATPSRGALVLEQKFLCDVARPSAQRYIWATTWGWHDPQPWSAACLWEGHSTSNHALASCRIGRMRIQNLTGCEGKVATCWNHANTGFQTWEFLEGSCNLSAAQLSWAHPCHWSCIWGAKIVDQRLRIFPPPQSSVAQVLLNKIFPFHPEKPAARI